MDIYDVLARDRWAVDTILDALSAAPNRPLEERRSLVAMLGDALAQYGRASNPIYGALLRRGADPATVVSAIESHTVACRSVAEMADAALATSGWTVAVALMGLLLDDYFEEQRQICGLARVYLPAAQARELAEWHERKRAAESADPLSAGRVSAYGS